MRMSSLLLLAIATALLPFAACGGGGGGGGGGSPDPDQLQNERLNGAYWLVDLSGFTDPGPTLRLACEWGVATGDRAGNITVATWRNEDDGTVDPSGGVGTYEVRADGRFVVTTPADRLQGGISADNRCAVLAQAREGSAPLVAVLLKREGSFDEASLRDDYHVMLFGVNSFESYATQSMWDVVWDFDGVDRYRGGSGFANRTTEVIPVSTVNGSYTVAGDGSCEIVGGSLVGGILQGGMAVVAGGDNGSGTPVFYRLLKAGTDQSAAALFGAYWYVTFSQGGGGMACSTGTMSFDGAGAYVTSATTQNIEGAVTPQSDDSGSYTVGSTGKMTLTRGGGVEFGGAVSADGRFFSLGGGTVRGDPTTLIYGIRK